MTGGVPVPRGDGAWLLPGGTGPWSEAAALVRLHRTSQGVILRKARHKMFLHPQCKAALHFPLISL